MKILFICWRSVKFNFRFFHDTWHLLIFDEEQAIRILVKNKSILNLQTTTFNKC